MKTPTGKLIPIGGSEARNPGDEAERDGRSPADFFRNGVLADVLNEINGPASRLVILPAASGVPDEMAPLYTEAFGMLGCRQVEVIQLMDRSQTDHPHNLQRIRQADGVFLTGGDQAVLVEKLAGSAFLQILIERYQHEGFVIAGTSAGAAAMSRTMLKEGDSEESLRKGMAETQPGLGFLSSLIIDTHFAQRGRLPRLTEALLQQPTLIGLGLSEDTGVVITRGNCLQTIGSGSSFILETNTITQTNFSRLAAGEPISVGNLKVHVMGRNARYRIDGRQFMAPPDPALLEHTL